MKRLFQNVRFLTWIIILFVFLIFACSKDEKTDGPTKTPDGWTIETVEDNVSVANDKISVAIDNQNKLHVCYHNDGIGKNSTFKYATNKNGKWSVSVIDEDDTDAIKGEWNDITVDNNGTVHIVYTVFDNEDDNDNYEAIRYARLVNGNWIKEDVLPPAVNVRSYTRCCIASDNNGTIHIAAAVFGNNFSIEYINNATGQWVHENACNFSGFSTDISMSVDGLNRPHIAYTDYNGYHLRTVTRLGLNTWDSRLISGNADYPSLSNQTVVYPSIAVNASGNEYILYHNTEDDDIWFYNNGTLNTLDYNAGKGGFCQPVILCDKEGYLHYLYGILINSEWNLFYGRNTSGSFICDQIFGFQATGENSDLAISSDNTVYILYAKSGANSLNIAYKKY